jgi:hypothetical protein
VRVVARTPDTPGHPANAGWEVVTWDDGDHVHVVPLEDSIPHTETDDGDCICGTTTEPTKRDDGSIGWVIIHHSLDGRERYET